MEIAAIVVLVNALCLAAGLVISTRMNGGGV